MRLNKVLAQNTSLSRRKADTAIANGRVLINGDQAKVGDIVSEKDTVFLDGNIVAHLTGKYLYILLNKPIGYVSSRDGQGAKTVYQLLPKLYQNLNIAGRLDKNSSGALILSNDGEFINALTHPSNNNTKIYLVKLDRQLTDNDIRQVRKGINIGDARPSTMSIDERSPKTYKITLEEGRNRQIRRTFKSIGYKVVKLHRQRIGEYSIKGIKSGEYMTISKKTK